jgi:hypothetical protein
MENYDKQMQQSQKNELEDIEMEAVAGGIDGTTLMTKCKICGANVRERMLEQHMKDGTVEAEDRDRTHEISVIAVFI